MSLAPASSRGAFLNARLAVNGIQCAARSLGTLTAGLGGLLSSIGILMHCAGRIGCVARYQLRKVAETNGWLQRMTGWQPFGKNGGGVIPDRGGRLAALRVRWYHPAHGRKTQK